MIHSSNYKPRVFPLYGDVAPAEIDRAQTLTPTVALNRDKIREIGRENVVGYSKRSPTVTYAMTQYEYASMEFWKKISNKADSVETITLNDFKTPAFDICSYLTDDDGTFRGTVWYPKLRASGFSINIGDPDAIIERSFDLIGEEAKTWQGNNKYVIFNSTTLASGESTVDLSAKAPVANPDVDAGATDAEKYIIRVVRVRAGVSTELTVTTDYTYSNSTKLLTIVDPDAADIVKIWYTSSTAPDTLFTNNDSDIPALRADSVSIYLYIPASGKPASTDYVYRLQSVSLDVTFDRQDVKEIGNKQVVQRGINDKTVNVRLGDIIEKFTIEEVLRGVAEGYGVIDVEKLTDSATLIIKFFDDNTKANFKYGMKIENLSPTDLRGDVGVNAYVKRENTLQSSSLTITEDAVELGI